MIGEGILLTVAHNIYDFNNIAARAVYFYPAQSNTSARIRLKVKNFKKHG
jgi:hypothetical protein